MHVIKRLTSYVTVQSTMPGYVPITIVNRAAHRKVIGPNNFSTVHQTIFTCITHKPIDSHTHTRDEKLEESDFAVSFDCLSLQNFAVSCSRILEHHFNDVQVFNAPSRTFDSQE